MTVTPRHVPPVGVQLSRDITRRNGRVRLRVRWTDPHSHQRRSYSTTTDTDEQAWNTFDRITRSHLDPLTFLAEYAVQVGDRYLRGLDPTSTASGYRSALKLRVLPALGHLPVLRISSGHVERSIDQWEQTCAPSTLKNTIAALTRVLDEAVRDELISTNPARSRAKRRTPPPQHRALRRTPTIEDVQAIAAACGTAAPVYGDFVLLAALLAARSSEVAGLRVGDIDWEHSLVTIGRQLFPGAGGLQVKPTKSRQPRSVPILHHLEPVLRRLTDGRASDEPLLRGPRGGALTTGSIRRATDWNNTVARLGFPGLRRHDLRHTGATWFANAGVPLHIVSDILGHASIETTKTYLHTDGTQLRLAAEAVDQHLAGATPCVP